jgi:cyclopropane fatty-acyl-phospholipid synthase-like methyltransferase
MSGEVNLDEVAEYYRDKLQRFGGTAQGMDWKNEETQLLRFEVISRYIDFSSNPSVLDVGCGNGEFYNYCAARKLNINYKGIDVVPEMVKLANERFKKNIAQVSGLTDLSASEQFDYVIASGTFNTKLTSDEAEYEKYFYENIDCMYKHAKRAAIFNCMTSHVDYRYDRLYYADIAALGEYAVKNLSRHFIIDHSYPLYEMTMAIFRIK